MLSFTLNENPCDNTFPVEPSLQVLEPKLPEDIYKSHLEEKKNNQVVLDSAKQNLAATFVNAFVNAGFGKDKLMTTGEVWLYKNVTAPRLTRNRPSMVLWSSTTRPTYIHIIDRCL